MNRGGCVGRILRRRERWRTDEEYKEKIKERRRKHYKEHREKINKRQRKWLTELNEFRNRHCKKCGKLLNYRTKGNYCFKHWCLSKK